MTMLNILLLCAGILLGLLLSRFIFGSGKIRGRLTIDPEEMTLTTFELDLPVEELMKARTIKIKIDRTNRKDSSYNAVENNQ